MSTHSQEVAGQPEDQPRRDTARLEAQERQRVNQDRIRDLINALGDPSHPLHARAVDELVAIGPPAVSALTAALAPDYPWLTSYRAAEALAQIGDGRANGALINALRHPNSNVRWSVVRALSEVGDTRTLIALRRVAHDDHGKTSWGESVSDTAQVALDRLQSRSVLLRFSEPIKTALVFVAMLAVLAFATSRVQALRSELSATAAPPVLSPGAVGATTDDDEDAEIGDADLDPTPTPTEEATPTPSIVATPEIVGRVTANANIRSGPGTQFGVIGQARQGDELVLLAESNGWYRVRLGPNVSEQTRLEEDEGYIAQSLVDAPDAELPAASPAP
jgi:hypothetical protein